MCGRFTLMLDAEELVSEFDLQQVPADVFPRYNIAPSQPLLVVTDWGNRRAEWMRWGLVPSWAKDPSIGSKMINARSETVQEKPSFRNAFNRRRCLILADGFYEWRRAGGKGPATPYYFHMVPHKPFAFAGLWEFWRSPEGDDLRTCTILTTQANGIVAPVHERMPVILNRERMAAWLTPAPAETLMSFLAPLPDAELAAFPVSRLVNSPENDGPELVLPLAG
jgi:putative SOS response-associated peptidase YedK